MAQEHTAAMSYALSTDAEALLENTSNISNECSDQLIDEPATNAGEDDDDARSCRSTTSTQDWGHEPLSTFQEKIGALCQDFWPELDPSSFKIEHMDGGSYNRIIGVSVDQAQYSIARFSKSVCQIFKRTFKSFNTNLRNAGEQLFSGKYILRIPWCDTAAWLEHEMSILHYVRKYTSVPVPRIAKFDLSSDNKIGLRYVLQERLPGTPAIFKYPLLNHSQKMRVATELGSAIRSMATESYSCAGILDPDSLLPGNSEISMVRVSVPSRDQRSLSDDTEPLPKESPAAVQAPLDMMKQLFDRQFALDEKWDRVHISPFKSFTKIAEHMEALGLFHDKRNYLTHMDLEPRNILIDIKNENTATLSGILDWDSAVFAPAFMNCSPPQWLWGWSDGNDEDETEANDIPKDEDDWNIKRAFEDAVGHSYLRYAYSPDYRIARDMLRFAIEGISSSEGFEEADALVRGWNKLHPDLSIKSIWDDNGDMIFDDLSDESDDEEEEDEEEEDSDAEVVDSAL